MSSRLRSLSIKRVGAISVGAALALSIAALPAQAADTAGLQKAQKAVTDRINARLSTLHDLQTRVAGFKDLAPGDRAALGTLLTSDLSGLTALEAKVAGETTVAGVRADADLMVNDYRVYLLVAPKVHLTHVLTVEADALAKLQKIHDTLAKNPKADKAPLADMETQIQAGDARINGQIAAVLAIPPGPDAAGITTSVRSVRDAAVDTRADIGKAVADAKKVHAELK